MRCLAPHLKSDTPAAQQSDDTQRHSAAQLMCILAVLKSCLMCCGKLEELLAQQLTQDLAHLIAAHSYVQASSAQYLKERPLQHVPWNKVLSLPWLMVCAWVAKGELCHGGGRLVYFVQEMKAAVAWTAH